MLFLDEPTLRMFEIETKGKYNDKVRKENITLEDKCKKIDISLSKYPSSINNFVIILKFLIQQKNTHIMHILCTKPCCNPYIGRPRPPEASSLSSWKSF